nr:hypothetical protein [Tanacetum cinerariifolium]
MKTVENLISSPTSVSVRSLKKKVGIVKKNTSSIKMTYGTTQLRIGTGAYEADECDQNEQPEQVCLSDGDIYHDPSLLRFYQNDDIPPRGNSRQKKDGEKGPEWVVRSKFEDDLSGFLLEKSFHTKGLGEMLDQHLLEMDEDDLVPIILGGPFLATARAMIDVYEGKPSLGVGSKTVTFNIRKFMKSKYSYDDYLYCPSKKNGIRAWLARTGMKRAKKSIKTFNDQATQVRTEGSTGTPR